MGDRVRCASFSPDTYKAVTASDDDSAIIWNLYGGKAEKIHVLKAHNHCVRFANFSPNGKYVLTASMDGSARKWSVKTGHCLTTFQEHGCFIRSCEWSTCSGGLATASSD